MTVLQDYNVPSPSEGSIPSPRPCLNLQIWIQISQIWLKYTVEFGYYIPIINYYNTYHWDARDKPVTLNSDSNQ